jgi:hypothetical protein
MTAREQELYRALYLELQRMNNVDPKRVAAVHPNFERWFRAYGPTLNRSIGVWVKIE